MQEQSFTVDTLLRVFWFDRRLAYDGTCVQMSPDGVSFGSFLASEIWVPQLMSEDEMEPPMLLDDAFFVAPSGRVWWTRRIMFKFQCRMNFQDMPFDTQKCEVDFRDFRLGSEEVTLRIPTPTSEVTKPSSFNGAVRAFCQSGGEISWTTTQINASSVLPTVDASTTFSFSILRFAIHLTRDPDYYIWNHVMPMALLVTISYFSFFISRAAVPARAGLGVVALLTLSNKMTAVMSKLPRLTGSVWLLDLFQVVATTS